MDWTASLQWKKFYQYAKDQYGEKYCTTFTPNNSPKLTSASLSIISAMQDEKGNIWFGTETNGVYLYDGQNFTTILSQKDINNSIGLRLNTITSMLG